MFVRIAPLVLVIVVVAVVAVADANAEYAVPPAALRVLDPVGFEVSIPADDGISLFAFHGRLNEEFEGGREAGTFARDVVKPMNGRFTFRDCDTRLKNGDRINFWTYVVWNGLGYHQEDGTFVVQRIGQKSGDSTESSNTTVCKASHAAGYQVPPARIRFLQPKGFEVSIPAEEGITLFAFHGKLNEEFDSRDSGSWSRDIIRARNGRFTFRDCDTKLKVGDTINFWTFVIWNGLGYHQDDGIFPVTSAGLDAHAAVHQSCVAGHATSYQVPAAMFVALQPKGFEVSIPADEGITLFAFHGKLNEEFEGREAGTYSSDVIRVTDGRFVFRDNHTKFTPGDVMHFWTFVVWNGLGYYQEDGRFAIDSNDGAEIASASTLTPLDGTTDSTPKQPCVESMTRINGGVDVPCKGELIFEDNFDTILDAAKWKIEQRFSTEPDHEFGIYLNRSDVVRVHNNQLTLGAAKLDADIDVNVLQLDNKQTTAAPPIALGQITTRHSFHFLYGRIEIRARLPYADWLFPQMFLQPLDQRAYGVGNHSSGQMRLAFAAPGEPLQAGVLLDANPPFRWLGLCRHPVNASDTVDANNADWWQDEFHVFALEWRPDSITVWMDNEPQPYCRIVPPFVERRINGRVAAAAAAWQSSGGPAAPFDRPFYVTLGVGVGGRHDFSDLPHREYPAEVKPWRNDDANGAIAFWDAMQKSAVSWPGERGQLQVDYVRVYAL